MYMVFVVMTLYICTIVICVSIYSEIFPYLVVMVGMEKVMIIVKAVVSTPPSNPVKMRIAEGLIMLYL